MMRTLLLVLVAAVFGSPSLLHAQAKKVEHKKADTTKPTLKNPHEMIVFTAKLMPDGKKHWTPDSVKVKKGAAVLRLVNEFDEPHGFTIKGLISPPLVVQAKATMDVPVTLKSGTYAVECHMHPAHVPAQLIVE